MHNNLIGELTVMDIMDCKPNYAALGRKYGMDWRTVKKYHKGYKGKPHSRDKPSKLDPYRILIIDKLKIKHVTVKGVYEFMVKQYGIEQIGSYSNFAAYVKRHHLKSYAIPETGHPRVELPPGKQAQVDWKEDIHLVSKYGEIFVVNVFHITLKYSRFSYLECTLNKRTEDVERCLVNAFIFFGGVPEELLFDNMSTVVTVRGNTRKLTSEISRMSKDFGFKVRLCKTRQPQTKGSVEARNKMIDWIRPYQDEFEDIKDLFRIVTMINKDINLNICQETQMPPMSLFYKEKEYLQHAPNEVIIDTYLQPNRIRVSKDALIRYGGKRYSVDPKLINEFVTVDVLEDILYIYYRGKLVTYHPLNDNPINYKEEHYSQLMSGKIKEEDMNTRVSENLKMMDSILQIRKVDVSASEATSSETALIAYISKSEFGKWVITHYAHLSNDKQLIFRKGMNSVLPYIDNDEAFIQRIKFSMKENCCRSIDFDCLINDFMATSEAETVLTDEGYEILRKKYEKELTEFIEGFIEDQNYEEDSSLPDIPLE